MPDPATFSISVRVQRVTTESAHISVPVTVDLMQTDSDGEVIVNEQGNSSLDAKKVFAQAIELSANHHQWVQDGTSSVHVHPVQTPPNAEQD